MAQFLRIAHGIDTMPVLLDLPRSPHLWDQNTSRKTFAGTPHAAISEFDFWAACFFRLRWITC